VATIRELRTRIGSVKTTQKVTRAMKMISAARLARASRQVVAARPYAEKLREVLGTVGSGVEEDVHPLITARSPVRNLEIVLFTSDRGLCGGYNANLIKHAISVINARADEVENISVVGVGRKGRDALGKDRRVSVEKSWTGLGAVQLAQAREIGAYLMQRYRDEEIDEAVLVYSEFLSPLTQKPRHERLLPVSAAEESEEAGAASYEIEPSAEELLGLLVPRTVEFGVFRALLENQAGEHGARMTAMDSATKNTEELIDTLTLQMNKARQAAITAELVDIVTGAEAL
jgi:F-type H+-transporting ATPase subunit gamma